MGKLNMNLLKGIEEQESTIENSKAYQEEEKIQKCKTVTEQQEPIKSTPAKEKKENTKPQKQSFSFRADLNKIEKWKLYAETIDPKDIGALWTAAIDEYISNHALTAEQQEIYGLKKKAAEMAKNQSRL